MSEINVGSPIKNFLSQSLKEIEDGLPKDYSVMGTINFDISVGITQTKGKNADIRVLSMDREMKEHEVQRINFSVANPKKLKQELKSAISMLKEMLTSLEENPKRRSKK